MAIKPHVFGSKSERHYYHKLDTKWGIQYRVYHNLPYTNVFALQQGFNKSDTSSKTITLSKSEWEFLLKTSIDFVLCDNEDRPMMCIEYDGLQEGFSAGSKYVPIQASTDKNRNWKIEFKLKVADTFDFLYIVLASRHFEDINEEAKISIADTIIAEWLVYQTLLDEANKAFSLIKLRWSQQQFMALSIDDQKKLKVKWIKEEWMTPERVIKKLKEKSPLQQAIDQIYLTFSPLDLVRIECFAYYNDERKKQPFDCGHPAFDDRDFGEAILYGEKRTISHKGYTVEAEAWIPVNKILNFWGFEIVLRDLVSFLALCKLKKIIRTEKDSEA